MQKQSIKSRALKCEIKSISVSFNSPRRKKRWYSRRGVAVVSVCWCLLHWIAPPVQLSLQVTTFRGEALRITRRVVRCVSSQSGSRLYTPSVVGHLPHVRGLVSVLYSILKPGGGGFPTKSSLSTSASFLISLFTDSVLL